MAQISTIKNFYLENYDFQIFVNKNCQTYRKPLDYMLATPITQEYYKSLQKGGCNEKRKNRTEDHGAADPGRTEGAGEG